MSDETKAAAAPESGADDFNTDIVVSLTQPMAELVTKDEKGKIIARQHVPDKAVFWAQPSRNLKENLARVVPRPNSGNVLGTDKKGALVARFPDENTAKAYLKKAGIDWAKVQNKPTPNPLKKRAA